MRSTFPRPLLALFAFAVALALVAVPISAQDPPAPPPADPADVESIDAIMKAVYEVISGDAGVARDWDRFRSLFAPGATLSPTGRGPDGTYGRSIITPDEYAEGSGAWLEQNGFHEVEIHRVTERYGMIAHAFSTYESRRRATDPEPFARGINSFQLLNDGGRWWVVSIYWQQESPDHPIPAQYLPGPAQYLPGPPQYLPGPPQYQPGPAQDHPGPAQNLPGPAQYLPGPGQSLPGG